MTSLHLSATSALASHAQVSPIKSNAMVSNSKGSSADSSNNIITSFISSQPIMAKAITSIGYSILLDRYIMKSENLSRNLYFAGATTAGIYLGGQVGSLVPTLIPSLAGYENGTTLQQHLIEISTGSASSVAFNTYILKNDYNRNDLIKRTAVIGLIDILSTYTVHYLSNMALNYFN